MTLAIWIVGVVFVFAALAVWAHKSNEKAKATIIDLLRVGGEWTGLELVEASKGVLKRGTVYIYLSVLMDEGLVERRLIYTAPGGTSLWTYWLEE